MKKLMMVLAGLLLLAGQAGAATAQVDQKVEDFIFLKFYQDAYRDIEKAMNKKLSKVTLNSGVQLNNCAGFLKEPKTPYEIEEIFNGRLSCSYYICGVLELVPRMQPHKGWRPESYAKELYKRFDFKSFRNSFHNRMAKEETHTMADLKVKGIKFSDSYTVTLDEKDWLEEVSVISDADINSNGIPDWIVRIMEHARRGTILSCQSVLLLDVEPTGLLKVTKEIGLPSE